MRGTTWALAAITSLLGCGVVHGDAVQPFGHAEPEVAWLLPWHATFHEPGSHDGVRRDFSSTTLFPFVLTFQLHLEHARQEGRTYSASWGGAENPFWAWSWGTPVPSANDPGAPVPRFETFGVPLLFRWREAEWPGRKRYANVHRVEVPDEHGRTTARLERDPDLPTVELPTWHSRERFDLLWDFGPSYVRDVVTTEHEPARRLPGQELTEAWTYTTFTPLALAGLGPLLWQSASVRGPGFAAWGHGPLVGMLGATSTRQRARDGRPGMWDFTLLGGILWYSHIDYAPEPLAADEPHDAIEWSSHAPLWGVVGWGHDDGEPVFRLLWIPIPLPG